MVDRSLLSLLRDTMESRLSSSPPSFSSGQQFPTWTTDIRSPDECARDYAILRATAQYPSPPLRSSLTSESLGQVLKQWTKGDARDSDGLCHDRLAVITGVCRDSVAYLVAREMALTAGLHLVLAGRSEKQLADCREMIIQTAQQRGIRSSRRVVVYTTKFHLGCLTSVAKAADFVNQLAQQHYNGEVQILANLAHVGSATAKLTKDGIEYNTGCNLIGTHLMTQRILPLIAPGGRIVSVASIGHALGTHLQPSRLVTHPEEGGAPDGFFTSSAVLADTETSMSGHKENDSHPTSSFLPSTLHPLMAQPTIILRQDQGDLLITPEQLQKAISRRGTQVGRSKMAILADTYHMSRLHPKVSFFTFHLMPSQRPVQSNTLTSIFSWNTFQTLWTAPQDDPEMLAACVAPLRAALDPSFRSSGVNQNCYYLHADGNPWTPMAPATDLAFGQACYEAAETLCNRLAPKAAIETHNATYEPPNLLVTESFSSSLQS